jgi:hypothetical protein
VLEHATTHTQTRRGNLNETITLCLKMKLIYLVLLLFSVSCKSIKIRGIESDSTQELIGKIRSLNVNTFHYPISKKDTIGWEEHTVILFDKKNKPLKQTDYYPNSTSETTFNYRNGLLQIKISKIVNSIRKTEYKYDKRKNLIEFNRFENDTLYFSKTSNYDSKDNLIRQTFFHPNYKRNNSVEKFTHDYKNRNISVKSFDENNLPKNGYLKIYYDKKGRIIKTETIYRRLKKEYSTYYTNEYDKLGNLTKRMRFDKNGSPKDVSYYKNIYDEKGNIIIREEYWKDKIIIKTNTEITYW